MVESLGAGCAGWLPAADVKGIVESLPVTPLVPPMPHEEADRAAAEVKGMVESLVTGGAERGAPAGPVAGGVV
ncbi:hypothetical protein Asp14428_43960 [Actinoplanes sp. NBRC 14428]|nr:hypothetical protein Asp14428_43960 [Actinoplanes sp. NBRC 14428]